MIDHRSRFFLPFCALLGALLSAVVALAYRGHLLRLHARAFTAGQVAGVREYAHAYQYRAAADSEPGRPGRAD